MKTSLKLILCVLVAVVISNRCAAQRGTSSNFKHIIDSLKITDGDEIKICTLYDDVVTEYLNEMKEFSTSNKRPTPAQTAEINKKFKQKEQEIKPQIESFRKKLASNYPQLMNFSQFCNYEAMRVYGGLPEYQKAMYKNHPAPVNRQ